MYGKHTARVTGSLLAHLDGVGVVFEIRMMYVCDAYRKTTENTRWRDAIAMM
jgi:hypothetical protein